MNLIMRKGMAMNFDFTRLIKNIKNDNVCLHSLTHKANYSNGGEKFILEGLKPITIFYDPVGTSLKIEANLPYFWQGHNFHFERSQMIEAVKFMNDQMNLNLFNAEVNEFEFGSILDIEFPANVFLQNHINYNGKQMQPFFHKRSGKLTGKTFEDSILIHKLYDAGQNIKNKLSKATRVDLSNQYGYDKEKYYIKIENHYKKPQIHFKQRTILMNDVLQNDFMQLCKDDLINSYKSIMKTGIVKLPDSKSDINAGTLPLILLKELEAIYHFDTEDLLREKIKSISEDKLSKEDKKARQKILKANLLKIKSEPISKYDISQRLEDKEFY